MEEKTRSEVSKIIKRQLIAMFSLGALASGLATGCVSQRESTRAVVISPRGAVYVPESTEPRLQTVGGPPDTSDVWTPGYWTYSNSRWVWMPSHFQTPVQSGTTWVAGHWDKTDRGWFWTPGHVE